MHKHQRIEDNNVTTRGKKREESILSSNDISIAAGMIPKESFSPKFDYADKDEYDGSRKPHGSPRKAKDVHIQTVMAHTIATLNFQNREEQEDLKGLTAA